MTLENILRTLTSSSPLIYLNEKHPSHVKYLHPQHHIKVTNLLSSSKQTEIDFAKIAPCRQRAQIAISNFRTQNNISKENSLSLS